MSKYEPLGQFLAASKRDEVPMTFAEIERVLGFPLPAKSKAVRAWWSNNPHNSVMTKIWLAAGFRSERVDMNAQKLVFRRIEGVDVPGRAKGFAEEPAGGLGQTGAAGEGTKEKHRRRHPLFGALKDVTWIAPDVDLTEPADPEWADLIDRKYGTEPGKERGR